MIDERTTENLQKCNVLEKETRVVVWYTTTENRVPPQGSLLTHLRLGRDFTETQARCVRAEKK